MNISEKNPQDLRPHPAIARMHRWAKGSDEFAAFCRTIQMEGILQPLQITPDDQVVDGEMRRQAAVRLGIESVPCVVVDPAEVPGIVISELLGRRHYTIGQRAFLVQDQMGAAWDHAKEKEHGNLRKCLQTSASVSNRSLDTWVPTDPTFRTVEDWARSLNVHPDTLRMAREIRALFEAHADRKFQWDDAVLEEYGHRPGTRLTLEEYFEAAIFHPVHPMGLGSVKKGIGGKLRVEEVKEMGLVHPGRHSVQADRARQLELFGEAAETLFAVRAKEYWPEMDEDQRCAALNRVSKSLEEVPTDLLQDLKKAVAAECRRRSAVEGVA